MRCPLTFDGSRLSDATASVCTPVCRITSCFCFCDVQSIWLLVCVYIRPDGHWTGALYLAQVFGEEHREHCGKNMFCVVSLFYLLSLPHFSLSFLSIELIASLREYII